MPLSRYIFCIVTGSVWHPDGSPDPTKDVDNAEDDLKKALKDDVPIVVGKEGKKDITVRHKILKLTF